MKTRWGRQVHDPKTWVQIATAGLCDEARRAIECEIMAHYEQALAEMSLHDVAPRVAVESSLQSLGDPVRARKGFRRVHLTALERRWLSPNFTPARKTRLVLLVAASWFLWTLFDGTRATAITHVLLTYGVAHSLFLLCRRPMPVVVAFHFIFLLAILSTHPERIYGLLCMLLIPPWVAMDLHVQSKLRRANHLSERN